MNREKKSVAEKSVTKKDDVKKRMQHILFFLEKEYPSVYCPLLYHNTLELLIAVMLSAQCTDERVNKVTPALFERFKTAEEYAHANVKEIEQYVHATGFYRNKARHIKEACQMIVNQFGGEVPRTMEELLLLPGVARKTANVILSTAFGKQDGIVVDTHVTRLTNLIGLVQSKNAVIIERTLLPLVPIEKRNFFSLLLIWHGRRVCVANRPRCDGCVIRHLCDYGTRVAQKVLSKDS